MKKRILFFSNLYPLPWEPTRAQYNLQQTTSMAKHAEISYLIPVPFLIWIKQVLIKKNGYKKNNYCLFPFFYLPKVGRSLHPIFMLLSLTLSIKPLFWFAKHDHVLASWAYPEGVVAALLKKIFNFKLTIDCLGTDINVHGSSLSRRSQLSFAFNYADTVTTKSQDLAKKVRSIATDANISTIYNGVNFELFRLSKKIATTKINLLFIGNIIKTKGIHELIQAAGILKKENIIFELVILGKGEEMEVIKHNIIKQNLNEVIKVIGAVPHDELHEWFQYSDVLILPSYREGVPNVIMEALASGIPVIATSVGGIPEVVQNNINGVLLNSYQAKDIVLGIKHFIKINWNSENIRHSVSSFTWENTAKQFLNTFENSSKK